MRKLWKASGVEGKLHGNSAVSLYPFFLFWTIKTCGYGLQRPNSSWMVGIVGKISQQRQTFTHLMEGEKERRNANVSVLFFLTTHVKHFSMLGMEQVLNKYKLLLLEVVIVVIGKYLAHDGFPIIDDGFYHLYLYPWISTKLQTKKFIRGFSQWNLRMC